jgi:hypothetical protein
VHPPSNHESEPRPRISRSRAGASAPDTRPELTRETNRNSRRGRSSQKIKWVRSPGEDYYSRPGELDSWPQSTGPTAPCLDSSWVPRARGKELLINLASLVSVSPGLPRSEFVSGILIDRPTVGSGQPSQTTSYRSWARCFGLPAELWRMPRPSPKPDAMKFISLSRFQTRRSAAEALPGPDPSVGFHHSQPRLSTTPLLNSIYGISFVLARDPL